jgi:purine-binding chemotaxis protein CheW
VTRDGPPDPARALREAFDASFAAPPRSGRREATALLAIRVGGEPLALPVAEIAGLLPARPIVAVPARRAELLGISGLRGAVLPVFALARLLGVPDAEPPRWFALARAGEGERVALALGVFEGHVLAPAGALHGAPPGSAGRHVAGLARLDGGARTVLAVPSLVQAITSG